MTNEVQLIKFKETTQKLKEAAKNKAIEIKRLQGQVAYYKKQAIKFADGVMGDELAEDELSTHNEENLLNVI